MRGWRSISVVALLLLGSVIMAFPFYWMAVTSLSSPTDASAAASAKTFNWIPTELHTTNYPEALRKIGSKPWIGFFDAVSNTVVITTLCVIGQVAAPRRPERLLVGGQVHDLRPVGIVKQRFQGGSDVIDGTEMVAGQLHLGKHNPAVEVLQGVVSRKGVDLGWRRMTKKNRNQDIRPLQ